MTLTAVETEVHAAGVRLQLLAERAAYVPAARTLLVADLHIGKAASFRRLGVPVPEATTGETLARLAAAVAATGATRVVFLGDLLHARNGRAAATLAAFAAWRTAHPALELVLVRGNHDGHAGDPPPEWRVDAVDEPWPLPEAPRLLLAHHPQASPVGYVIAGHLHPAAAVGGAGPGRLRLPSFHFGAACGVLPAFGAFTGMQVLPRAVSDRVFVVADDVVRPLNSPR